MADFYFVNAADNLYSQSDNWFEVDLTTPLGAIPSSGDVVFITENCTLDVSSVPNDITISAAKVLTVPSDATLSGVVTVNGGIFLATSTRLTVAGDMTFAHDATLDGTSSTSFIKITGTMTSANQTVSDLCVHVSSGGEWIVAVSEVFVHADTTSFLSADDEGDLNGGVRSYGTVTIHGELDISTLMEERGIFNLSEGGTFRNRNDCNIRGVATFDGALITGPRPLNEASYVAVQEDGVLDFGVTGTFQFNQNAHFDFYTTANTSNRVDYPQPVVSFW